MAPIDALEHSGTTRIILTARVDDVGVGWVDRNADELVGGVDLYPAPARVLGSPYAAERADVREVNDGVIVGIDRHRATAQSQIHTGRRPGGAVDTGEGLTVVGALPQAIAPERSGVHRVINGIDGHPEN